MYPLIHIRERVAGHQPETFAPGDNTRQAAVAVILREVPAAGDCQTEILFIQRAQKDGDPWSGHMAFPGGHLDPTDAHLRA
ncbi:MAG: hypothetical protein R3E86_02440, partial [Pseudomonadales bacterium]